MSDDSLSEGIALLSYRGTAKRRAGAKMLRKLRDVGAGPALLHALQIELEDPRAWETHYQMVMALGECGYREALPFLRELASQQLWATMVYVGVGDAIVRLSAPYDNEHSVIIE